MGCIKYSLLGANIVMGAFSCLLIVFTVQNIEAVPEAPAYYLIGTGVVGVATCLFGIVTSIKHKMGFAVLYAFFVTFFMVEQILGKIYLNNEPLGDAVGKAAVDRVTAAWNATVAQRACTSEMDAIQKEFHCCALTSAGQYTRSNLMTCISCYEDPEALDNPYKIGCVKATKTHSSANIENLERFEHGNIVATFVSLILSLLWMCYQSTNPYAKLCFGIDIDNE